MLLNYNFFSSWFIFNGKSIVRVFYSKYFELKISLFFVLETYSKFMFLWYSVYYYYLRKFSFVGKTYRFFKKKKKLRFIFNRAHKTIIYFKNFFKIKKKKKNKCKFLFLYYADIGFFKKYLKIIRKLNVFTRRGIKINRMPLFKKVGKISTYR